jgi:hypothetical protein
MTVTLTHWHFYIVISIILLYFTFKSYPKSYGSYINLNGVENFFFGVVFVIFTLIWGGVFWW